MIESILRGSSFNLTLVLVSRDDAPSKDFFAARLKIQAVNFSINKVLINITGVLICISQV